MMSHFFPPPGTNTVRAGLSLLYLLLIGAATWLTWRVYDLPLVLTTWGGYARADSLSAFFSLLTLLVGCARLLVREQHPLATLLMVLVLLLAYNTSSLLVVATGYLLVTGIDAWVQLSGRAALDTGSPPPDGRSTRRMNRQTRPSTFAGFRAERYAQVIWALLPCLCLWLAYSAVWDQSGTWRYTAPATGAALSSFVFWFALLATIIGVGARAPGVVNGIASGVASLAPPGLLLTLAWFYPLIRLYSLGQWNLGWHLATLLLGGAGTLWAAWHALTAAPREQRAPLLVYVQFGLALTGIGLGTGAGIAAGCYALIVAVLLALGLNRPASRTPTTAAPTAQRAALQSRWALWLLSGAIPLTAPFVSAWLALSAAAAGGVLLLAGCIWLAMLMSTIAVARRAGAHPDPALRTRLMLAAGASGVLGVTSPSVVQFVLRPIVRQLQGGLTLFGEVVLWPWGGLLTLDSARQEVAALPSMTIVALMLILGALAWLLLRLGTSLRELIARAAPRRRGPSELE